MSLLGDFQTLYNTPAFQRIRQKLSDSAEREATLFLLCLYHHLDQTTDRPTEAFMTIMTNGKMRQEAIRQWKTLGTSRILADPSALKCLEPKR